MRRGRLRAPQEGSLEPGEDLGHPPRWVKYEETTNWSRNDAADGDSTSPGSTSHLPASTTQPIGKE